MDFDLTPYFQKYEALLVTADAAFERVKAAHATCVACATKCADCCHALFDLTLIEALYINHCFNRRLAADQRADVLEKADRADRQIHRLKRRAYRELKAGRSEEDILTRYALERVRCPLLNEQDLCELYNCRPVTCRLYGIPTAIGGMGRTCGLSGFETGKPYPTVNLDVVHTQLQQLSAELVRDMKSKYPKLADLLVPLSMALLTDFDEYYLGMKEPEEEPRLPRARGGKHR
jgi:Fe-S-cluster containining protein